MNPPTLAIAVLCRHSNLLHIYNKSYNSLSNTPTIAICLDLAMINDMYWYIYNNHQIELKLAVIRYIYIYIYIVCHVLCTKFHSWLECFIKFQDAQPSVVTVPQPLPQRYMSWLLPVQCQSPSDPCLMSQVTVFYLEYITQTNRQWKQNILF